MSIRSYRVLNLLIWTCVASFVEFCLFEKLYVECFAFLAWFMHCQQGGEVWAWNALLDAFRRFSSGFEPFLGSGVQRSDRSRSPVWPVRVLVLCTCWAPVWPVVVTGLTGVSWSCCNYPVFKRFACIRPGGVSFGSGGTCICAGGALCGCSSFGLVVCALCLSFVLSRMCWAVALA
jgi:hypothetical protein